MSARLVILTFLLGFANSLGSTSPHLVSHADSLRRIYPYGLLGDDHGLLNQDDLAINTCVAKPAPFSRFPRSSFYWRCFNVEATTASCINISDSLDPNENDFLADGRIVALDKQEVHTYWFRKRIGLKSCTADIEEMKKAMSQESYVCVSGKFVDYGDDSVANNTDHRFVNWLYDKLKTTKACVAYFGNAECTPNYWRKEGCTAIKEKDQKN